MGQPAYERLGRTYSAVRRPDPRIEQQLWSWLRESQLVLNVGAGTGSYEPQDRTVIAVEPSSAMIGQRRRPATVVQGAAERLPFANDAFDAAMAILTVHHWTDPTQGLAEVRRVTNGPVVVLTFDKRVHDRQWLVADYLPMMADLDSQLPFPEDMCEQLGDGFIEPVLIPRDCMDGFCHAWWCRPEAYLDPIVQAGISGIARLPAEYVARAMQRLSNDIDSGRWHDAHADVLSRSAIDAGYRLVVGGRV